MLALDMLLFVHASFTKLAFGHWVLRFVSSAGGSAVCICEREAMFYGWPLTPNLPMASQGNE